LKSKKVGFIPHNLRNKKVQSTRIIRPINDSLKLVSPDDVWPYKYYQWKVYSAAEAINCFKESHHPTMFNLPDSLLNVSIELNMALTKKTKFVDNFSRICLVPHGFERKEKKNILVFCKEQEKHHSLIDAGALFVGGVELVKKIQNGDLNIADYDYVLAHPNILLDIVPVRGILKKKFPNPRSGSIDADLHKILRMHIDGVEYKATKHEHAQTFGTISTAIGRLTMETPQLEENLVALLKDVDSMRPKRDGLFVTRVFLSSEPCTQQYKINPFVYIDSGVKENADTKVEDSDSEDDEKAELEKSAQM